MCGRPAKPAVEPQRRAQHVGRSGGADVIVESASLRDALCLGSSGSLVSIVGGGGKSALLFALGEACEGRVVLSTTTRIFAAQMSRARACVSLAEARFESLWPGCGSGLLVVGEVAGEKARGVDAAEPASWLARSDVDHVVVEADGSRMRPTKLPAEHEPVIARGSTHVAIVAGIDALDGTSEERCHRPERVREMLGKPGSAVLGADDLGKLLAASEGGCKQVPAAARAIVVLNKVESDAQFEQARRVAARIFEQARVERVIAGALEGPEPDQWQVYRR